MSKELAHTVSVLKDRVDLQQVQLDTMLKALEALEQIVSALDPRRRRNGAD